jgi:hypothetical protein
MKTIISLLVLLISTNALADFMLREPDGRPQRYQGRVFVRTHKDRKNLAEFIISVPGPTVRSYKIKANGGNEYRYSSTAAVNAIYSLALDTLHVCRGDFTFQPYDAGDYLTLQNVVECRTQLNKEERDLWSKWPTGRAISINRFDAGEFPDLRGSLFRERSLSDFFPG